MTEPSDTMTGVLILTPKASVSLLEWQDSSGTVLWESGSETHAEKTCPWCGTAVKTAALEKSMICPQCGGNLQAEVS